MSKKRFLAIVLDHPHTCRSCGKEIRYGGRRSAWSVLPGVCRHMHADMSGMKTVEPGVNGCRWAETWDPIYALDRRGLPVTPAEKLRARLSAAYKGIIPHWWTLRVKHHHRKQREKYRREWAS